MHFILQTAFITILLTVFSLGAESMVAPVWSPYPLEDYSKSNYSDTIDTSLSYLDTNKTKHTIKVNGQYWNFRYPSTTKEHHQEVRQTIDGQLLKRGAKVIFADNERTLYVETNSTQRRYFDIYYGWNYEVRIYLYQENLLLSNQSQEITFEAGKEHPQELVYKADFDGEYYYYLMLDILEGEGVDVSVRADMEDEAVRIRYDSQLRCSTQYYQHYSMYDLDPYKALHEFTIKPLKGSSTKVKLTLVKTPYSVPPLGEISTKAGLLKMTNSLSSLPTLLPFGHIAGSFKNEGDYLPNGDAIYWLNNGYYTLMKKNLQTNLVPLVSNHQTTIDWPLFYDELESEALTNDAITTKMTLYDVHKEKDDLVSVNFSLSHLPKDINLTQQDFSIFEAGTVEGKVLSLEPLHQPMNVVILLDSSGSMKKSINIALESVQAFIEKLPQDAQITLVDFDTTVKPLTAKSRQEMLKKLKTIKADGATALYDSIIKGVELLKDKNRASIVLFTDGKDANYNDTKQGSKASFDEMIAKVQAEHIPIYPIAFGTGADTTTLSTIAQMTKTTYYQGDNKERLGKIFEDIANTLSSAYRLVYQRGKLPKEGSQSVVNYMVDVSGSQDLRFTMNSKCEGCGYRYEQLKSILAQSIESLPSNSFVQLNTFSDEVKTLQIVTQDKARALAGVGAMKIGGGTKILKAIQQGFKLSSVIPSNRRYFIFITDAADDAFKFNEEEQKELKSALLAFKQSGIQTFWLGMVDSAKAKKEVENLATISGGEAFVSANIDTIKEKILELTQKVGESNVTQTNAGVLNVKLKSRDTKSGSMVVAVGEKSIDFPLLVEKIPTKKIRDIAYKVTPFDTDKESYNLANAQKIYGDDLPLKEVQLSKIIPLKDENNQSLRGNNRAVEISMQSAYLFERLKGIRASRNQRFLVLDVELKNLLNAQKVVLLEDGSKHPSSWLNKSNDSYKTMDAIPTYKIPNLQQHLFIRVNNSYEIPFNPITWALEKPLIDLDAYQLMIEAKVNKEGLLAFVIPDEPITSLSLHLYDTNYGALEIPIIGKLQTTKESIEKLPQKSFTKLGDNFALKVESESLQEEIQETKAKEETLFDILDISLQSNLNALLKIDASQRMFLKIKSDKGDYLIPTHAVTTQLPMGLYTDIALAPSSNNRFKLAFQIPKALKDNPKSLLVELKDEDVDVPITTGELKADKTTLLSSKVEGIELNLNGVYETKGGDLAFDVTLNDQKDGESTRLHDAIVLSKYDNVKSFATIVDKSQAIKADHKGLGSFSVQSELKGRQKWVAPSSKSSEKILGYESSNIIFDGTSQRFVVLFDKKGLELDKSLYLISPIFKELSYQVNLKKLQKLPKELEYLLSEKVEFKSNSSYDDALLGLLKKVRAKKVATGQTTLSKLPMVSLDSPDALAKIVNPLPISLYGAEQLETIDTLDKMLEALKKLEWVPALNTGLNYSPESIVTQGWGSEYEMFNLFYQFIKKSNVPITMGYYNLTSNGIKALENRAKGIPVVLKEVPFIQWGEESMVFPFLKPINALKAELDMGSQSLRSPLRTKYAEVRVKLYYENKHDSVHQQIGGMGSALGGGSVEKEKSLDIFKKSFNLDKASNMPIDLWFNETKDKKGKHIVKASYFYDEGIQENTTAIEEKIIPKKLEIKLYNGEKQLDEYTFDFKKGQNLDELFFTFAFASPELSEEALKTIEVKRKLAFEGIKNIAPFSQLQWANRAKIYKFIALQSKYENHLQKVLEVNAKRHKTPRAIMAMIEKTPDKKLVSSLDLRMVFNDVYGDINKTRSFNIMSGMFSAEAETKLLSNTNGLYENFKKNQNQFLILPISNKNKAIDWMKENNVSQSIINRYSQSKLVWFFPKKTTMEQRTWFEIDKDTYQTRSVLENKMYGATESAMLEFEANMDNIYLGIGAGVLSSIFSEQAFSLMYQDYCTILSAAETFVGYIGCGLSLGEFFSNPSMVGAAPTAYGCAGQSEAAGMLNVEIGMFEGKNGLGRSLGGFANGFGYGTYLYFKISKSSAECQ